MVICTNDGEPFARTTVFTPFGAIETNHETRYRKFPKPHWGWFHYSGSTIFPVDIAVVDLHMKIIDQRIKEENPYDEFSQVL